MPTKTKTPASEKKVPAGDTTRTARAVAHLERLDAAKGKRLVVDLDAEGRAALDALLASRYGDTQREVVIRALVETRKREKA